MRHDRVNPAFLKELDSRAFKLLPHLYRYDQNRQVGGLSFWDEAPGWTYEDFCVELNVHCENRDERAILRLDRELERLEIGVKLVSEVGEYPEPDWIVEGQVVRNGLTFLIGDSGSGKTTYCFYLTDGVQHGKDLFGLRCKRGTVIFVENDESAELLRSHRDKVGLPYPLVVATINVAWDATNKKFNEDFARMLYYHRPDLVIVDAYTSLGIPDITRPDSGLVLDELRRLAVANECAFLIVHHVNKAGEQMGSSLHKAKMDSVILLENEDDVVTLTQQKVRGTKFQPKAIAFDPATLKMTPAKVNLKAEVKKLKSQGIALKDVQRLFPTSNPQTIARYYREK